MKKKELFKNVIFLYIIIFVLFEPDFYKTIPTLDNIYHFLEGVVAICIASKYVLLKRKDSISILIILFYIPMFFSTILYKQELWFAFKKTVICMLFPMLCEIEVRCRNKYFFRIMADALLLLNILNIFSFIFYPNGMVAENINTLNDKIYFLSSKNGLISWILPPIIINMAYYFEEHSYRNKKRLYITMIVGAIGIIYTGSSTGLVGYLICLGFLIVKKYKLFKRFTIKKAIALTALLFFLIIIVKIQNYFVPVIEIVFGKSATFIGRGWIWDQAIDSFKGSPIWGYGVREKTMIITDYGRYYSAHNFILDTLINGGILSLLVYVIILVVTIRRCKGKNTKGALSVLIMGYVVFAVCTLTETPLTNFKWWIPNILLFYSTGENAEISCGWYSCRESAHNYAETVIDTSVVIEDNMKICRGVTIGRQDLIE